jgi:hypothetical protein
VTSVPDEIHLSPESIEALATRLGELLGGNPERREEGGQTMLTAAEVSRRWGVSRRWVYDHAEALGAVRLGGGPRPRLRFDAAEIADRLGAPRSARHPWRADVRRSPGCAERRGSDSLSPPTRASFVESQIAAGGRANAPGPASQEVPRRAPKPRCSYP